MKITMVGAGGGEITGPAYYVQAKQACVLVDCGLFQGGQKAESLNRPPVSPKQKIQQRFKLKSELPRMGETIEF